MSVLDYQAQHYLRRIIDRLPDSHQREQLKNLRLCGVGTAANAEAVYVLASDGRAKVNATMLFVALCVQVLLWSVNGLAFKRLLSCFTRNISVSWLRLQSRISAS